MMSNAHKSTARMHLAKVSPLVVFALLVALIVFVPGGWRVAGVLLTVGPETAPGGVRERDIDAFVDVTRMQRLGVDLGLSAGGDPSVEGMFDQASMETWRLANRDVDTLVRDGAVVSLPFAHDDAVFDPIAAWERDHSARVWAWTVLPFGRPPLVASARTRGKPLKPVGQPPGSEVPTTTDDGGDSVVDWLWNEAHYTDATVPALDPMWLSEGASGGMSGDDEAHIAGTIVEDGVAWRYIFVKSIVDPSDFVDAPPELLDKDPRDAGYSGWLEAIARQNDMDIWVFGPLETDSVPLRLPEGATEAEAAFLGEAVWPSMLLEDRGAYSYTMQAVPQPLQPEVAELAGGPYGALAIADFTKSPIGPGLFSGVAPQSMAFLVVFDDIPGLSPGPLERAFADFQHVLLVNFRTLFAVGSALLGTTLVVSASAFLVDRRRRLRQRAADERERMRRDAHDKVFNRLSALSKRIAQVSDAAVNGTAGSLAEIAEEIRATVGELQQILGDDVDHTSSALASVSLRDQLVAVCSAQAARLGIEVLCEVSPTVPDVAPDLGWDLQCVTEEAITNAARHGGASRVMVAVDDTYPGHLMLTVSDNGSGSAVTAVDEAPGTSTGLRGMRDRVERHGGYLLVESDASGTTVTASVELRETEG